MNHDLVIIGGGPAGCAAALFAAKAKRNCVILHKGTNPAIETFHWLLPGLPKEFKGKEWLDELRAQVSAQGIDLSEEVVTQATLGASDKKITTASGKIFQASAVVVASGCYERKGLIEGEERFVGYGVYYNAYQDGAWFENKTVAAEGKTESVVREVLYLARFAQKIYFVVPAMKLEVPEKLAAAVRDNPKIEVLLSASLKGITGQNRVESIKVLSAGEEKALTVDGVFLYSRQSKPQHEFLKGTVEISEEGCVLVDDQFMTSIPGVFACGEILSGVPQLPFVSASQGMLAAMYADRYVANLNW